VEPCALTARHQGEIGELRGVGGSPAQSCRVTLVEEVGWPASETSGERLEAVERLGAAAQQGVFCCNQPQRQEQAWQ